MGIDFCIISLYSIQAKKKKNQIKSIKIRKGQQLQYLDLD